MPVMGITEIFRKVFLVDLIEGLGVTFRYQDPKEIYTEQYPLERPEVAERYRGAPRLNVNPDTGETLCISCDLCALACPEHLIVVTSERNEKTRRKELTNFTYDLSRCMFCGLCEDACPTDALELTQDFELASFTREGMILGPPGTRAGSAAHRLQKVAASCPAPKGASAFECLRYH
jgi:NADH-quinone oxidoreductase subunit I